MCNIALYRRILSVYFFIILIILPINLFAIETPQELETAIRDSQRGQSIDISSLPLDIPFLSYRYGDSGPRLLLSDDPEYIKAPGIASQESFSQGSVRLYFYNVNDTGSDNFKISILLENLSDKTGNIHIFKRSVLPPSTDYIHIGKTVLLNFYQSNINQNISIPPRGFILLDEYWEKHKVKNQELAHGIYEFYTNVPLRLSICGLNWDDDIFETFSQLTILAPAMKHAGRGLFPTSNRYLVLDRPYDTKDGIRIIRLADGRMDRWVKGFDASSNMERDNFGNFGILYTIEIPFKSSDNRDLAVLIMSPPAGVHGCVYSGVMGTLQEYNLKPAGYFFTPSDRWGFSNSTTSALVGIYQGISIPRKIIMEFSPPAASCLPADLILVPIQRRF